MNKVPDVQHNFFNHAIINQTKIVYFHTCTTTFQWEFVQFKKFKQKGK